MNNFMDFMFVIMIVVAAVGIGLYYLNKRLSSKMTQANSFIESSKQVTSIYVIDKKRDRISNVKMPKMVMDQVPSYQKMFKNNFVQAKIGPQIMTLMCDKHVFKAIPEKKNVKVELAGIYIVSVVGMKSKE